MDLTLRLTEALSRWQATCEADALAIGGDVTPWIFPSEARTPLEAASIYKRFRVLLSKAKLPRFRLYDLRHTSATHLLALGAPITYVAVQLGHAKPTTTLAHYAHWLPRGDKTWIDHLAETRGSKTVAGQGGNSPDRSESSVESTSSPVAQLVERLTVNQEVAGSSPARGATSFRHLCCSPIGLLRVSANHSAIPLLTRQPQASQSIAVMTTAETARILVRLHRNGSNTFPGHCPRTPQESEGRRSGVAASRRTTKALPVRHSA